MGAVRVPPLTAEICQKSGKGGKNRGKKRKIGKKRQKSGSFFHFFLPLLTDRAGYATGCSTPVQYIFSEIYPCKWLRVLRQVHNIRIQPNSSTPRETYQCLIYFCCYDYSPRKTSFNLSSILNPEGMERKKRKR